MSSNRPPYPEDDEDADARAAARRRENLMQQRLRKARGEDVDDTLDDDYQVDPEDDYLPRSLDRPIDQIYSRPATGGGCAQATLYLVLGALAALLIVIFVFNQAFSGIGDLFRSAAPSIGLGPTPTAIVRSGAAVVQRIQQLNRLETTRYTLEQVVEIEQPSDIPVVGATLFGDKLLLIASGTVVAGIDLAQLQPANVLISADGSTVTVYLPPAQIFSSSLDNTKTRVYSRDQGWFASPNKDLETRARQEGESKILAAACEDGILLRATEDGQRAMEQLLSLLDFERVEVVSAPVGPCVAPAATPTRP